MALPIFAFFMTDIYANESLSVSTEDEFEKPLNFNFDLQCNDEHISADRSTGEGNDEEETIAPEEYF